MADPVMMAILQSGGLSLQELFARVGAQSSNGLRVASLLKNGEVRLDISPELANKITLDQILTPNSSEEEIAAHLQALISAVDSGSDIASDIAVVPTVKAWRNPFAAA
jgi:hypothetical protein